MANEFDSAVAAETTDGTREASNWVKLIFKADINMSNNITNEVLF